jgi:peptide chain release factor 1
MDVFRSAAGGQSVEERHCGAYYHLPTVSWFLARRTPQLQNRMRAMSILQAFLEVEEEKRRQEIDSTRRMQVGTGERSEKIRTYNYPQSRVTDHRINLSSYNLPAVMDGDFEMFIDELATRDEAERLAAAGMAE